MKKQKLRILSVIFALILIITSMPITVIAETTEDGFEYSIIDDGTAEITDYTGDATELNIPSEIDGYTVTSIGNQAFQDCAGLTNVNIPDSVTIIGDFAFFDCTGLTSVTIPDSVTIIGDLAFYGCTGLTSITIPDSVTVIGYCAFTDCTGLTSVTIPASVTIIGALAFGYCLDYDTSTTILTFGTIFGDTIYRPKQIDGFTIYGVPGTAAEEYANNYKFEFIDINTIVPAEPTTQKPTTEAPTTQEPTTAEPTTEAPTTQEPTTAEPTTEELSMEEPATGIPTVNGDIDIKDGADIKTVDIVGTKAVEIKSEQSVNDIISGLKNENAKIVDKDGKDIAESGFVGTGCKVQILDKDGKAVNEYTVLVPMDVDGDGKILASDARTSLRASAKLDKLENVFFAAANADGNNELTAADARKILRVSAKIDTV